MLDHPLVIKQAFWRWAEWQHSQHFTHTAGVQDRQRGALPTHQLVRVQQCVVGAEVGVAVIPHCPEPLDDGRALVRAAAVHAGGILAVAGIQPAQQLGALHGGDRPRSALTIP